MKGRLVRALGRAAYGSAVPVATAAGARMTVDPSDYIGWELLCGGAYEPRTLGLAARLLDGGGTFVDAGANIGLFTTLLGRLPGVRGVSVEPHPGNFARLEANVRRSGLANVRLCHVALDAATGLVDLEEFHPRNAGTIRVVAENDSSGLARTTVAAVRLDTLLHHADMERVTVLKVDVEGYELPVLSGMDWKGPLRPKHVLVEFMDYGGRFGGGREALRAFFEARGYVGRSVTGEPLPESDRPVEDNAWFASVR